MKTKLALSLIFILFSNTYIFSQSSIITDANYGEYTLENTLQVFAMEDFSSATIRLEYSVRAGISAQNQSNTGFFTLYSRLIKKSAENYPELKNIVVECNADSARYIVITTPAKIPAVMEILSQQIFAPAFSDQLIRDELSSLKTEVMQYAFTPAAFINASIDSRVFSNAPWKQDSGIYPAIFTKTTPAQARTILSGISRSWYVPQNSGLFISGSIKKEAALALAKKTFGSFPAALNPSKTEAVAPGGKQHKFVIHDPQLSEDLTQIVVQYTSFSMPQCDLTAAALNNDSSTYKKKLTATPSLNIRGAEYVNISAAHKNGNSRLIFQSLLERNKQSPVTQCEDFVNCTKSFTQETDPMEYMFAKKYISTGFSSVTADSRSFMEYLSQFWAIENLSKDKNEQYLSNKVLQRSDIINSENVDQIQKQFNAESPFVFVLVNSKIYTKNKNAFTKAGYEPVTQKNGSWYMQKLQQNASVQVAEENSLEDFSSYESKEALERFITENRKNIHQTELKNGIPVCLKTNPATSKAVILLSIKGGKFADNGNPGFEAVMANALASNIQKELNRYSYEQILEGFPDVSAETLNSKSIITVECDKDDTSVCLRAIGDALIFSDIIPANADSYVYQVQTQKRLSDASPVNQMYFRGIKYLYDDIKYRDIFDSEKDILQRTTYTDILAAYPRLLNSSLYSVVIAGNFNQEAALKTMNETLGLLSSQKNENYTQAAPKPDFPSKSRRINLKLRHLFYTDVKAEDAGPMPAILVPTKEFLDPVQYWLPVPSQDSDEAILFNAILLRLKEMLNESSEVKLLLPSREIPAAAITFLNVKRTNLIDILFAKTVQELKKKLSSPSTTEEEETTDNAYEKEMIKNAWIMNTLSECGTNKGCAKLISEGNKPEAYLNAYQLILDAQQKDFNDVAEKWLKGEAPLRIYSTDSKK